MKIVILGSCVTRDALEFKTQILSFTNYYARSSLASIFSKNPVLNVNVEKIESNFQRRMVLADLAKSLATFLKSNDIDLFIYDAIDERFDLLVDPEKQTLATFSNEMRATGYQKVKHLKRVVSGTNIFYDLWEKGWVELIRIFREKNALSKIRINKVFWAIETESGENFLPGYSEEQIRKANAFLERIYQRIALDLPPQQFYIFPRHLFKGAESHKWGKSPFHFSTEYYLQLIKKISRDVSDDIEIAQTAAFPQMLKLVNYFPSIRSDELEVFASQEALFVSTNVGRNERLYVRSTRVYLNGALKTNNAINIVVYVGPQDGVTANATFYSKSGHTLYSIFFPVNQVKLVELDVNAFSVSVGVRIVGSQSFFIYDCAIGSIAPVLVHKKAS